MCGLVGYLGETQPAVLPDMLHTVMSRGPDESGVWLGPGIALGHRRLKVVDMVGGAQPSISEHSGLVFNGEIYNAHELHRKYFTTPAPRSDTLILHQLLEAKGADILSELRGMYALAFYRHRQESLLLARDAFGQKPLFYARLQNSFVFASSCRAIRCHPEVSSDVNLHSLGITLMQEAPAEPATLYQHIHSVPAGGHVMYQKGQLTGGDHVSWDEKGPEASFEDLFEQATRRRLISDVPVGFFLSGGLDSSAVAWQARQCDSGHPLKTFSLAIDDPEFDESSTARLMSKALGSEHHEGRLTGQRAMEVLPEALEALDQPLADASLLPTYEISRLASEQVTVVLSGDGADDLMAGYVTFQALACRPWLSRVWTLLEKLGWSLGRNTNPSRLSLGFKLQQFRRGMLFEGGEAAAHWMSAWTPEDVRRLIPALKTPRLWTPLSSHEGTDMVAFYINRYLRDQILPKVDRASMAHSLEVRSPFLDVDLARHVLHRPFGQLHNGCLGKLPLRQWARHRLPPAVIHQTKRGFGIPLAKWLRHEFKDWLIDTVSPSVLNDMPLNSQVALDVRDGHLEERMNASKEVWALAVLCHWWTRR